MAEGWRVLSGNDASQLWQGGLGVPFPAEAWVVEGDTLYLKAPSKGGSLYSKEIYDNFELAFEWKLAAGGNSGVKYMAVDGRIHPDFYTLFVGSRVVSMASFALLAAVVFLLAWKRKWIFKDDIWRKIGFGVNALLGLLVLMSAIELVMGFRQAPKYPPGLEYQMIDVPSSPTQQTGALYDLLPSSGAEVKRGDFNESRIAVAGRHVEHWLNGRKVLEYELGSGQLKSALARSKFSRLPEMAEKSPGRIELQNHGSQVWFRDIRIRVKK